MAPWYLHPAIRYGLAALLAGLAVGGVVAVLFGYHPGQSAELSNRSSAEAIGSDRAAVSPTPAATAAAKAKAKAAGKPVKAAKHAAGHGHSAAIRLAALRSATSGPNHVERGGAPARRPGSRPRGTAPRRASQRIVSRRRGTVTPGLKQTPSATTPQQSASSPQAAPAPSAPPAPTPTSAPPPAATPVPAATPDHPNKPPHPPHPPHPNPTPSTG